MDVKDTPLYIDIPEFRFKPLCKYNTSFERMARGAQLRCRIRGVWENVVGCGACEASSVTVTSRDIHAYVVVGMS